jgi:hypothetical protein
MAAYSFAVSLIRVSALLMPFKTALAPPQEARILSWMQNLWP